MDRGRAAHIILWTSHSVVLIATTLGIATAALDPIARAALAAVAAAPLLLAVPGLRRGNRYTYQWLTVLLVLYIGVAAVEVVATLGAARLSAVALFAALLEIGLLLRLIRLPDPRPAVPRE